MTNKEAIYIINRLNTYYCTDEDLKALDLAIKALETVDAAQAGVSIKIEVTEIHKFAKPDDVSEIKFGDEE